MLLSDVPAIFFRSSLSVNFTGLDMSSSIFLDWSAAILYPDDITVGCTFWLIRLSASCRSAPATMTAVVVPSPTKESCVLETSTIILAAGCSTSISLSMVTPSLVITISPSESTSILSIPLGPRLDRTALAMLFAASILFFMASLPVSLFDPSFNMNIGCPPIIMTSD